MRLIHNNFDNLVSYLLRISIASLALNIVWWVIFHSTNERSRWTKDIISNPNLNNSILLKNANLNKSILLKSVSYCYCYCSATNGIFRSESRALLGMVV